ncbi:hypothetical protein M0R01_03440 [bacterium]|nr:hypothetical protein [bacterium]
MQDKDKLAITPEDEKAVEEKLHEFSLSKKEEETVIRLTPSMLSESETKSPKNFKAFTEEPLVDSPKIENIEEKITKSSFSPNYNIVFYKYSKTKKIFDFLAGFITVFAMYCFLNIQPLIIFVIFLVGAMEAALAFKSNRMFIVWGFVCGSIFSIVMAILLSLGLIYFPTNQFIIKIFSFLKN